MTGTFRSGWLLFWKSVSGQFGMTHWLGFLVAATVSDLIYAVLKAIVLGAWSVIR